MAPRKALPKVEEGKELALPEVKKVEKTLPQVGNMENTVLIGGEPVELQATHVRYQRDRTANFYRVVEMYPLVEILSWEGNELGDGRTGDQALLEWLIAVFDDSVGAGEEARKRREERAAFVKDHYNDMTTETIEQILAIFRRLNKINDKEDKLKNALRGTGAMKE